MIEPGLPEAPFALPWDDAAAPEPVLALTAARREIGDRFVVRSGASTYLFVFDEPGLREFYALAERDASKGLADYRMLVRKLPLELFAERRTFPHDLFGAQDVEGYLDNLDWAIEQQVAELGNEGVFDVFALARRVGHRLTASAHRVPPVCASSCTSNLAGATHRYASSRIASISCQSGLRSSRTPIQPRPPT